MYGIRLLSPAHEAPAGLVGAGALGDGVAVRLPDGSTMTAPNAVAASAVRHALTQLADAVGAYHEAGLDLPRLAQEQDVGAAVSQGSLRPGDLACGTVTSR